MSCVHRKCPCSGHSASERRCPAANTRRGLRAFRDGLKELGSSANFNHFRTVPYGLERIDVIRGPSSVLYGQIAPGGLVNAITKRPTSETIREVQGKIGTNDLFEGAFDLSGASDPSAEFMFRLTGLVRDSDAQIAHFADFVPDDRVFSRAANPRRGARHRPASASRRTDRQGERRSGHYEGRCDVSIGCHRNKAGA